MIFRPKIAFSVSVFLSFIGAAQCFCPSSASNCGIFPTLGSYVQPMKTVLYLVTFASHHMDVMDLFSHLFSVFTRHKMMCIYTLVLVEDVVLKHLECRLSL